MKASKNFKVQIFFKHRSFRLLVVSDTSGI